VGLVVYASYETTMPRRAKTDLTQKIIAGMRQHGGETTLRKILPVISKTIA